MSGNPVHDFSHSVFETVAAASLLIASRGGASPQKFEKRAPDNLSPRTWPLRIRASTELQSLVPYSNGKRNRKYSTNSCYKTQQTSAAIDRQHGFWNTTETNQKHSASAANWANKLHIDSWAGYRQLTIRQAHNATIYRKCKHVSQTPDCDQGITSVPIGKLQLLDKFSKGDI